MEYTNRYGSCLDGRQLAAKRPAGKAKVVGNGVPGACATPLWAHESNDGGIGPEAVRQAHCVNTGTPTVPSLGMSTRLGTIHTLATHWDICGHPPFPSGLVTLLSGSGLTVSTIISIWLQAGVIEFALSISSFVCAITIEAS